MISYVFDHEYAGDVASLGLGFESADNDYEIVVSIEHDNPHYDKLAAIADEYYAVS